jgi:hypothetical protein
MPPSTDRDRTRSTRASRLWAETTAEALVLDICTEAGKTTVSLPPRGSVILGRSRTADVAIDHESVSRKHALLHVGSQLLIQDLGSRNGTRVRTQALEPRLVTEVEVGVPILLGSVTCLVRRATQEELGSASPPESMPDESERRRIARALAECGGNQTKAAKRLGISRRTLVTRLGTYGLPRPRKVPA